MEGNETYGRHATKPADTAVKALTTHLATNMKSGEAENPKTRQRMAKTPWRVANARACGHAMASAPHHGPFSSHNVVLSCSRMFLKQCWSCSSGQISCSKHVRLLINGLPKQSVFFTSSICKKPVHPSSGVYILLLLSSILEQ